MLGILDTQGVQDDPLIAIGRGAEAVSPGNPDGAARSAVRRHDKDAGRRRRQRAQPLRVAIKHHLMNTMTKKKERKKKEGRKERKKKRRKEGRKEEGKGNETM